MIKNVIIILVDISTIDTLNNDDLKQNNYGIIREKLKYICVWVLEMHDPTYITDCTSNGYWAMQINN